MFETKKIWLIKIEGKVWKILFYILLQKFQGSKGRKFWVKGLYLLLPHVITKNLPPSLMILLMV